MLNLDLTEQGPWTTYSLSNLYYKHGLDGRYSIEIISQNENVISHNNNLFVIFEIFVSLLIPLFWTSSDASSGLKDRVGSLIHAWWRHM